MQPSPAAPLGAGCISWLCFPAPLLREGGRARKEGAFVGRRISPGKSILNVLGRAWRRDVGQCPVLLQRYGNVPWCSASLLGLLPVPCWRCVSAPGVLCNPATAGTRAWFCLHNPWVRRYIVCHQSWLQKVPACLAALPALPLPLAFGFFLSPALHFCCLWVPSGRESFTVQHNLVVTDTPKGH